MDTTVILGIGIAIGIVIASVVSNLILSIAGNILTDPIKNYFVRRMLISRKKKVSDLQKELDEITFLCNDSRQLIAFIGNAILRIFTLLALEIFLMSAFLYNVMAHGAEYWGAEYWSGIIFLLGAGITLNFLYVISSNTRAIIYKVRFYATYKSGVVKRIEDISNKIKALPES